MKIWDGADGPMVFCFAGCHWQDVRDALRRDRLVPDLEPGLNNARWKNLRQTLPAKPDDSERHRVDAARALWYKATPATDTAVETYLHARGITIPIPPSIRFLPAVKHGPERG